MIDRGEIVDEDGDASEEEDYNKKNIKDRQSQESQNNRAAINQRETGKIESDGSPDVKKKEENPIAESTLQKPRQKRKGSASIWLAPNAYAQEHYSKLEV